MSGTVATSIERGVGTLRLNRPDAMNSLDAETARGIIAAVAGFAADARVRVMVLTGDGPAFSAGGDFNWVLTWPKLDEGTRHVHANELMDAVQAVHDFPKPSVARVHGATVGGGVGLMLACDFAVASSKARFGLTSARNGLLAGIAIPVLIEAVGPRRARQLLMHAGTFDAARAFDIGLIDRMVEPEELDSAVGTLVDELKLGAPSVQMLAKRLVRQIDAIPHDVAAADMLGAEVANQCVTDEALEGMKAFLDKRKPKWAI